MYERLCELVFASAGIKKKVPVAGESIATPAESDEA
jgi:hypothetical protein